MRRVDDELRDAWRSLAEAEGDQPGYDYERGYLTGWHDERRHIRRRLPDGGYRDPARIAEFQAGYRDGRVDGHGRAGDWWPDWALGRMVGGVPVPGSGEPVRRAIVARRSAEKTAQARAEGAGAADVREAPPAGAWGPEGAIAS